VSRRQLPLDSPNWWSADQTLKSCQADPLFQKADLIAAVEQELVRIKVEFRDESVSPAKRVSILLTK
jgi:hypothetical protein